MSSRRGRVIASSDAAEHTSDKRFRTAPSTATALTGINALAFDALCQVVLYAPFSARLKAISLVCKRWRAAVLHSIKSISFFPAPADALSKLITLFPSLTDVALPCAVSPSALPRSVQALTVRADALPDESLARAFYATRHPNLTSLCLRSGLADVQPQSPVFNTVRIHSTQITEFSCSQLDSPAVRQLVTSPWPVLRKLSLTFLLVEDVLSFLDVLPALAEFHYNCLPANDVMRLPDRVVRLLRSLFVANGVSAECLARVTELSPTCHISAMQSPPAAFLHDHEARLTRSLSRLDLGARSWQWLARFQALETLVISHGVSTPADMPEPVSLPRLKMVTLGTPMEPWPAGEGILYATLLLRTQPGIQRLRLSLTFGTAFKHAHIQRFLALVRLADSLRLREFDVTAIDIPEVEVPGVQFGWSVLKLNTPGRLF